ncbi:MAG: ABC transporter ATP-binding protein [Polyangiaceae bacterium]
MTKLSLRDAGLSLGGREVLSGISLELGAGDFVALVGPNGSGKTSLIKLCLGLYPQGRGEVRLDGEELRSLTPKRRAAGLAWLPQRWEPSEPLPVLEVVAAARYRLREPFRVAAAAATRALDRVGAADLAERHLDELSGGELQRVLLAAVVAQEAPLLFFDEPANHLDPQHQIATYRLLGELRAGGAGVLCVTHDINLLAHIDGAEKIRVVGMRDGRIVLDTRYSDPDLAKGLSELYLAEYAEFKDGSVRHFYLRAERTPGAFEASGGEG